MRASRSAPRRTPAPEPEGAAWTPDAGLFRDLHRPGASIPVFLDVPAPAADVVDLLPQLAGSAPAYLFETAGAPPDLERRTFLAWDPEHEIVLRRGWLEVLRRGRRLRRLRATDPLALVREELRAQGATPVPYADGFCGGLVGYVAYDFKNYLERLPDRVRDDLGTPDLRLGLVRRVVGWDARSGRLSLRASVRCGTDARRDWERARAQLALLQAQVAAAAAAAPARRRRPAAVPAVRPELRSNLTRSAYDRMLARAHEYILGGHIYQANLSHRFEAAFTGRGLDLYRRLRDINPSPFATYMRFPEHEVVSCSPERLVRLVHDRVETRPIAGTRPRGQGRAEDRALQRDLLADDKERAEHLVIVDMARNDIGRVCEAGSVRVQRFMRVEAYSHVRHLVSNVTGVLRADRDAVDLLAATFPGASITGVPKIRCMQIIDELEAVRRGVYTGSAGYIGLDGSMDFNILIRTFLVQDGRAYFHVGGGIVADSDAEREYQETLAKGRALQEALLSLPGSQAARRAQPPRRARTRPGALAAAATD